MVCRWFAREYVRALWEANPLSAGSRDLSMSREGRDGKPNHFLRVLRGRRATFLSPPEKCRRRKQRVGSQPWCSLKISVKSFRRRRRRATAPDDRSAIAFNHLVERPAVGEVRLLR